MQKMVDEVMHVPELATSPEEGGLDLMRFFAAARRRWHILLLGLIFGIVLGIAYVATATPVYRANVHISIGLADAENARELSGVTGISLDEGQITTEIQVLRSEQIAARVVQDLDLVNHEAFLTRPETGLGRVVSGVKSAIKVTADAALGLLREDVPELLPSAEEQAEGIRQKAIALLRSNMDVGRIQRSRVLNVSYASVSPELSARIANAIAKAYIEDQIASKYEATQRATDWLKERSEQLRIQSNRLDNAVEVFRQDNNLVGVAGDPAADTQLQRLNQQVADARAELVDLQARSKQLEEIVSRNDTSAVVSSTATQSITSNLRARYLDTLRNYNSLVSSLGEDHGQTQRRLRELTQLEELMFEEIKRSAAVARNDVRVAEERLASLEAAQDQAADQLGSDNTTLVELRELERNAETVRSLYTSFLQRYQQSLQEQSFPVSDARILNPARAPGLPSSPKLMRIVAATAVLSLLIAIGWIAIGEFLDNKLRTEEQIRNNLGLEFFGGLTRLSAKPRTASADGSLVGGTGRREVLFPEIMRYGADKPLSEFAETLRTAKMGITLKAAHSAAGRVIGVVSCFPGEGKTTTAANFAGLLAAQGASVMLIDGDMRNPGLTRALGTEADQGLVDVLIEGANWQDVMCVETHTGTHIIPNRRGRVVHTSELLASPEMERLLADCAAAYDYVIVDLPPLGPVIDARAVLHNLNGMFFVAKWGATNLNHAISILRSDPRLRSKCYGAFLNMFDAKKASSYSSYDGASHYYGKAYTRYYHDR